MRVSTAELIDVARALITPGDRRFLGITGAPGAGKSTLAELVAAALGDDAALVSMDGFHLSNTELRRLGRLDRKGASDTFDAAGYVNLLQRLRARTDPVVYAPWFDRSIEESIGSAISVPADVPLIITEGNYLLSDGPDWRRAAPLLDESWYVEPGEDLRVRRLVARHQLFGRTLEEALDRAAGSDGRNAEVVRATRARATRIVETEDLSG